MESIDSAASKMQRFILWLEENGASFSSLKINAEDGDGIRSVTAVVPIGSGKLGMHIPRSLLITPIVIRDSRIGKLTEARKSEIHDYTCLAAFLLQTRREGGFWKPYVDILPAKSRDHPPFFSEVEIAYLKGSYCQSRILLRKIWMAEQYEILCSCLAGENSCTLEEFTWAMCAVISRSFLVVIDGQSYSALVPLADMLDHSPNANLDWRMESSLGFVMAARERIDAGALLRDSYGRTKSNAILFLTYGFCIDDNPADETRVTLPGLAPEHPCAAQAEMLGVAQAGMRAFMLKKTYGTPEMQALFSYLRLGGLEGAAPLDPASAGQARKNDVPPLSRQNEVSALRALASVCECRMRDFDTSIEEDEALLKEGALPRKLHYAVTVRHGEKRVLQHYIDLAQALVPLLEDLSCRLDESTMADTRFADYFADIARHLGARPAAASGPGRE